MKFRATIMDETNQIWVEDHDVETDDPEKYMDQMNSMLAWLNPHQPVRKCIKIQLTPHGTNGHSWVFVNLDRFESVVYRRYKCTYCGITGKKMTKGGDVIRDAKFFDNEKYGFCAKEGDSNATS